MKKVLILTAIFVLFVVTASPCHGIVDVTVLNKTFIRSAGAPVQELVSFPGISGLATLKLTNGGLNGTKGKRISSATISLNGQVIFSPSDFNQNFDYLEKQVSLIEGQNTLSVLLKSTPDGKITIQIIQGIEANAAGVVGSSGGNVEVTDPDNLLYGTKIEIPRNALNEDKIITINKTDLSSLLPEGTVDAGPFIDFGPNGTQFLSPVQITIPYDDKDNDGFVDYSDISEDQIAIYTFNQFANGWEKSDIISQDSQKNTITFLTNHFSVAVATIFSVCTDPAFILTIDGLRICKLLPPVCELLSALHIDIDLGDDFEPSYLRKAVLDMGLLKKKSCIVSYSGSSNFTLRWDGDPYETENIMADLNNTVKTYYDNSKCENKKFILVTHSWGTILGMLALKYNNDINPDLFITLSSPLGTTNAASPSQYPLEAVINDFTVNKIEDTYKKLGQPSRLVEDFNFKWINYWAWGVLFSGPFYLTQDSFRNEKVDESFSSERDYANLFVWHAVTSLDKTTMDEANVWGTGVSFGKDVLWNAYGKDLFNKVKSVIQVFGLNYCTLKGTTWQSTDKSYISMSFNYSGCTLTGTWKNSNNGCKYTGTGTYDPDSRTPDSRTVNIKFITDMDPVLCCTAFEYNGTIDPDCKGMSLRWSNDCRFSGSREY